VVSATKTVSVRPVKLGPTDGGYTAVLSGVQPGEVVVTDGTDRLRDGTAVTVPVQGQTQGQDQGQRPGQGGSQPRKPAASAPDGH
jgi:multidrug efflux system membrane fusion protein